jgi:hypothetical protein
MNPSDAESASKETRSIAKIGLYRTTKNRKKQATGITQP